MNISQQNKIDVLTVRRSSKNLLVLSCFFKAMTRRWRTFGLSIVLLLATVTTASAMSADGLTKCLKKGGGIYAESACRLKRIESLKLDQHVTSQKVRLELLQCTPQLVGYDYKSALINYAAAQKNWARYLTHNCNLVSDTFGQGTAVAEKGLSCEIELRILNLKRSNKFLEELREKRSYLLGENDTEQFKQSPAIVCK